MMSPKDFTRPADMPRQSSLTDKMNAYLSSPKGVKAPVSAKPDDMPELPSNLLKSRMNAFGAGSEGGVADEKTEPAESPSVSGVTLEVPTGGPKEGTDGAAMGGVSSPPHAAVYPADMPRQQSLKHKMNAYLSFPKGRDHESVARPKDMPGASCTILFFSDCPVHSLR